MWKLELRLLLSQVVTLITGLKRVCLFHILPHNRCSFEVGDKGLDAFRTESGDKIPLFKQGPFCHSNFLLKASWHSCIV